MLKPERKFGENRSEEHTSELQSPCNLVCRLLLEKTKKTSEITAVTRVPHSRLAVHTRDSPRQPTSPPPPTRPPPRRRSSNCLLTTLFFLNKPGPPEFHPFPHPPPLPS